MVSVTNNKLMWFYSAKDCIFKKSVFTKHSEIYIESQPQLALFHLVKNNIYSHFKNVYPSLSTTVLLLADRCQIFIMFKDCLRNRNLSINIILCSGCCSDSYSTYRSWMWSELMLCTKSSSGILCSLCVPSSG